MQHVALLVLTVRWSIVGVLAEYPEQVVSAMPAGNAPCRDAGMVSMAVPTKAAATPLRVDAAVVKSCTNLEYFCPSLAVLGSHRAQQKWALPPD